MSISNCGKATTLIASKALHAGDADYYTQFRVPKAGNAILIIKAANAAGKYTVQVNRWPLAPTVKTVPNHRWQDAQAIPSWQDRVRVR